jgi:peptidoglycan/xylan/chitin deacetylase (PgdA/CDA1 family)
MPPTSNLSLIRRITRWVPVLCFHEVLPDSTHLLPPYAISQSGLRAVLDDFTGRGYTSGALDEVVGGAPRGKKRLVLTFDDGTCDFLEHALPVLQEFNFSATLFIVAGLVGKTRKWAGNSELTPVPLMGADELRSLHAQGFAIGSHTLTHPNLPRISPAEARRELAESKDILSDMIGEQMRWFAYPYVAADYTTRAMVREAGYVGALGGYNRPHELYYLNRIDGTVFTVPQLRLRTNGLVHLARETARKVTRKA